MEWQRSLRIATGCLVAAGMLAGCGGRSENGERATPAPARVETAIAASSAIPEFVEVTGSVRPISRVEPGTKILGRVDRVPVREGDRVRRGQTLAELERRDLAAAVEQARAAVAMAEAQAENTEAQHRRITDLHARGSATTKSLEDATAAWRVAGAAVEQARANLAAAEVTLGYASIVSPVEGWVVEKHVEPGDMASPGVPMFAVEDLSRVRVRLEVPESDIVGVGRGDACAVRVDVLDREWEAVVDRVVPANRAPSRTYEVIVVLDNPDAALKSGMFARASFARGEREAVVVPATAVVRRGQLEGLFVVGDDGLARLRWVRLRDAGEGRVEVLSGLAEGEAFVVAPPPGFADATPAAAR